MAVAPKLSAVQRRVLGVLIEKAMTTPEYYPMTINALTAGSNQRSNRDPVMSLDDGEVGRAVWELQQLGLVAQAEPDRSARANRFRHLTEEKFGWSARDRAIMGELLLRGPQTPGELRGRASRMSNFETVEYVQELLVELGGRDPSWVRELPRSPGQRATAWAHRMYLDDEALPTVGPALASDFAALPPPPDRLEALEIRIAALESSVAELRDQVAALLGPRSA